MSLKDFHWEKDLPYVIEQFEKVNRKEKQIAENIPFKRKDGSIIYADINSALIIIEGNPYILSNIRDITERKRTEEELRSSKQIIEGILNAIPVRIFWKVDRCCKVFGLEA